MLKTILKTIFTKKKNKPISNLISLISFKILWVFRILPDVQSKDILLIYKTKLYLYPCWYKTVRTCSQQVIFGMTMFLEISLKISPPQIKVVLEYYLIKLFHCHWQSLLFSVMREMWGSGTRGSQSRWEHWTLPRESQH